MEEIIKPVSKELLKAELTEDKRLRMTNKSNNQIYIITHQNAPNVMREIGRLREIAFRAAGGGTGLSMDIDEYDTMEHPYKQIPVTAQNFFRFRIPYDQLLVGVFHCVVFINIH